MNMELYAIIKKLMDDRLKFTGSIRYDKAQNFDGNYSPRVSFSLLVVRVENIILEVHSKQDLETNNTRSIHRFQCRKCYFIGFCTR
jgi:hypothetical protein